MNAIAYAVITTAVGASLVIAGRPHEVAAPPPPKPIAIEAAGYTYLPLSGPLLVDGARAGTNCLALWPHLVRHPSWSLAIVEFEWSVLLGSREVSDIEISDRGQVRVRRYGDRELPEREFFLTERELARLRDINDLPCAASAHPDDHVRTFSISYAYRASDDGARIPVASPMGEALDGVLRTAAARYVPARIAVARRVHLELRVPRDDANLYRVRVAAQMLTVKRGHRLVMRRELTDEELVDLADWQPSWPFDGCDRNSGVRWCATGTLFDGDRMREPLRLYAERLAELTTIGKQLDQLIDEDIRVHGIE